jgi:hypothetical protein
MTFGDPPAQICDLLRRQGRVSYWALQRRFDLSDNDLEDLRVELFEVQELATDRDGKMLVWTGGARTIPAPVAPAREIGSDWCFMLVSPAVQSGKGEQFACIHEVRYGVIPVGLSRGVFSPLCLISLRYVERVERTCAVYRAAVAAV